MPYVSTTINTRVTSRHSLNEGFMDATVSVSLPATVNDIPIRREATVFLSVKPTYGVSSGRAEAEKQIPHLRVTGRNIRFLKSDLELFRATFKPGAGYGKTWEKTMDVFFGSRSRSSGGWDYREPRKPACTTASYNCLEPGSGEVGYRLPEFTLKEAPKKEPFRSEP
jgi:hypothetical protein